MFSYAIFAQVHDLSVTYSATSLRSLFRHSILARIIDVLNLVVICCVVYTFFLPSRNVRGITRERTAAVPAAVKVILT